MVALLGRRRRLGRVVVVDQVGIPAARLAAEEAVEPLEAATERPALLPRGHAGLLTRGEVPLADAVGVVAVLEQHLGDEPVLERDPRGDAGEAELNSAIVAMPFEVALRPVSSEARVGEHSAVVWKLAYRTPLSAIRLIVGVCTGPPKQSIVP